MSIEPFLTSHPRTWLTMKVSYPLSSREWTFVGAPSETVEEREWRKRVTTGVAQSGNVTKMVERLHGRRPGGGHD